MRRWLLIAVTLVIGVYLLLVVLSRDTNYTPIEYLFEIFKSPDQGPLT